MAAECGEGLAFMASLYLNQRKEDNVIKFYTVYFFVLFFRKITRVSVVCVCVRTRV